MPERTTAYFKALFAVTAWGASFIVIKLILREVSPVTLVWLRFAIGITTLGAIVLARRQFTLPRLRELPIFFFLGGMGITFHQWLQSNGLVTAAASTSGWIVATNPVFIAILGWIFLHERLRLRQVGGIALAGFGVLLVISKGNLGAVLSGSFGVRGDWLVLISAVNWSVFSIVSRYALAKHPAARMMLIVMAIGWLLTGIQFFSGGYYTEFPLLSPGSWLGLAFLGIICTGLAYVAWYDALKALPASQVGVFLYFQPLVSLIVAAAVLSEAITAASILGGTVILLGVWLVNRRKSK